MKLPYTILNSLSQARQPGFGFMAGSSLLVYLMAAVFVAVVFSYSGVLSDRSAMIFTPPKAFAAVHGATGGFEAERAYSEREERYIMRAVANNPENLIKLDSHGVRVVLDDPEMVRADLPTVMWQYRTARCVLDIYFHSDSRDAQGAPVVHYETRARDSRDKLSEEVCLSEFMPRSYGPRMVGVSAFYKSYIR